MTYLYEMPGETSKALKKKMLLMSNCCRNSTGSVMYSFFSYLSKIVALSYRKKLIINIAIFPHISFNFKLFEQAYVKSTSLLFPLVIFYTFIVKI